MTNLYRNQSYQPKYNAQANLQGRTHYVDDQTLKFHYSRIVNTFETDGGLLFALIESCALDHQNRTRGFRFVVFDIFGHVIARPDLDEAHKTHDKAKAAMWNALNEIDAVKVTREGMKREREAQKREHKYIRDTLRDLKAKKRV